MVFQLLQYHGWNQYKGVDGWEESDIRGEGGWDAKGS